MNYSDYYSLIVQDFSLDFDKIQKLVKESNGPILDLGAGAGRLMKLERFGKKMVYMDISEKMVQKLNCLVENPDEQEVVQGSALKIPFLEMSFGLVIISLNALAEMTPVEFVFGEVFRVLKNGGKIYFLVENPENTNVHVPCLKTQKISNRTFSYFIDLFKTSSIGDHTYLTYFCVRDGTEEKNYFIKQTFLPFNHLKKIMEKIGFFNICVEGNFGDQVFLVKKSDYMTVTAEKIEDKVVDQAELKNIYDDISSNYNEIVKNSKYFFEQYAKEKLMFYIGKNITFLDLGCANGYIGSVLETLNITPVGYGVDFSLSMLAEAKKNKNYFSLLHYDLNKGLSVSVSNFFDIIFALGITEFISKKSTRIMIKNIYQSLRKSGKAIVAFEVINISNSVVSNIRKTQYSKKEIIQLMNDVGVVDYSIDNVNAYISPSSTNNVIYHILIIEK